MIDLSTHIKGIKPRYYMDEVEGTIYAAIKGDRIMINGEVERITIIRGIDVYQVNDRYICYEGKLMRELLPSGSREHYRFKMEDDTVLTIPMDKIYHLLRNK